ncbi:zinc ribbon domain-containing protein [Mycobacterium sp. SMC-13]|uniref:zinc ribbon domain-containing protein n=1 Tax=Mycobacterium sp. SMC-13 TaxID=3381626 RepID=UPI00387753D8
MAPPSQCDRWFPSSQTCCQCGARTKLPLKQRVFTCLTCGYGPIDRDVHAAVNIAAHAVAVASDTGETQNARRGTEAAPTSVGRRRGADETGRPRQETGVATPAEQSTGHLKHADQHALPLVS